MHRLLQSTIAVSGLLAFAAAASAGSGLSDGGQSAVQATVGRFAVHEVSLTASGEYANPYTELDAEAIVSGPVGKETAVPLFWDGGATWRFRVAPDRTGEWNWTVKSRDPGLDAKSGAFTVVESKRPGSIVQWRTHRTISSGRTAHDSGSWGIRPGPCSPTGRTRSTIGRRRSDISIAGRQAGSTCSIPC